MEFRDDEREAYNALEQEAENLPHIHDFTQRVAELLSECAEDHNTELLNLGHIVDPDEHWRRFADRKGLGPIAAGSSNFDADWALEEFDRAFGNYIKRVLGCIVAAKLVRYKAEFCNAKHEGRSEELPELAGQVFKYEQLNRQFPCSNGLKFYLEHLDGPQH
jgi:hypothetical protein